VLENCLISAFEQVALPGREPGVLKSYEDNVAREGMEVKEGDVLAHLDNADLVAKKKSAELEILAAKEKAESDAELEVAKATKAVGEKELEALIAVSAMQAPSTYHLENYTTTSSNVTGSMTQVTLRCHDEILCGVSAGDGVSSTIFWWRRWIEHSRSNRWTQPPCVSAKTWISTWRGRSTRRST
jgi:hypothetical protein